MPIAGVITKACNQMNLFPLVKVRPIIVLLIVLQIMKVIDKILKDKLFLRRLIGIR